jgi:5-carboxymethyl-2-hydroxymuconate isomerase
MDATELLKARKSAWELARLKNEKVFVVITLAIAVGRDRKGTAIRQLSASTHCGPCVK